MPRRKSGTIIIYITRLLDEIVRNALPAPRFNLHLIAMQKLRALFRILFTFDPTARLDLFTAFPIIRSFFKNRRNMAFLRTFGDFAFSALILLGIFGPQDPGRNISLFLAWGIWWSGVVLSWFFVGKLWCGVCPVLGIGRLLQRYVLSLNLDPPHALRRYFIHIAVLLFAAIIWAESVTDLKFSPLCTALLLLSILIGATAMAMLFKGQAWCRYVCPLGKVIGAGATMSMIELRATPSLCRSCDTTACKKGRPGLRGCPVYLGAHNIKNSLDCLLCGRCVLLCERESPRLLLRNPFVELLAIKGRDLTCTFIIPFLAGSQWARFIVEDAKYQSLIPPLFGPPALSFSLLLIFCFAIFLGIITFGNRLLGMRRSSLPIHCSPMIPVLTPLAFSGELIYRLKYLLSEAGNFPTVLTRQFGLTIEHYSFVIPASAISLLEILILALGCLGSFYVIALFRQKQSESGQTGFCRSLQILVSSVAIVYFLLIG